MSQITEKLKQNNNISELPETYFLLLEEAIDKAIDLFGNNLLSITIGGSGGKGHIHIGWSDLDLFFILKEFEVEKIAKYNNLFNNEKIRLESTFYTLREVEKQMLNARTKIMVYEKNKYDLNPTVYGENYFSPVNYETIRHNDVSNLPSILQIYKDIVYDLKNDKIELNIIHIKKMLILLKCLLNRHNIFSFGYEEVLIKYSKLCSEFNFEGQNGFKIIKIIDDFENIKLYKEEIISFSEDLFNFIYKYC